MPDNSTPIDTQSKQPLTKQEITSIVNDSMDALYKRIQSNIGPLESRVSLQSDRIKLLEIAIGTSKDDRLAATKEREKIQAMVKQNTELVTQLAATSKSTIEDYQKLFARVNDDNESLRETVHLQERRVNHAIETDSTVIQRLNQMDGRLVIANAHIVSTTDLLDKIQKDYESIALFATDVRSVTQRINSLFKSNKTRGVIITIGGFLLERIGAIGYISDLVQTIQSALATILGI